jgi:hypothetical protein
MFHVLTLDADVLVLYKTRAKRSEVLLYKRNEGFLSKLTLPEKGAALERRLARSLQNILARPIQ